MILEALVRHYDQLADDPESGVAPYGYSLQQVGFCIVLQPDGKLHAIEPLTDETSGKSRPVKLVLPGQSKPPGSGINPCFLWDNPTYLLGCVPDGREPAWAMNRFVGFRDRHLGLREAVNDEGYSTVCAFLEQWDPADLSDRTDTEPLTRPGFGVFRLRGEERFVHQRGAVDQYWRRQLAAVNDSSASPTAAEGFCLVTGQRGPIARLHEPKIKGVSGAQSSGATLVSFNLDAFNSAGKEQGLNASVGEQAAFKYPTALNALLADSKHRVQLGDTTVVFWTEKPASLDADAPGTPDPADALAEAFGVYKDDREPKKEGETQTRSALRDFLERYRQGKQATNAESLKTASAPFYVLGLSPNAARISVRFWLRCTVAELAERLDERSKALAVVGLAEDSTPSTWQLIRSTARDNKEIKPNIAGELTRAFLNNRPLPRSFAGALLTRVRIEGEVNATRAAGLKAYILTNGVAPMDIYLNREHPSLAYHAGRILAILAFAQEKALGDINASVVKKNFAAAMSMPGLTLGRLQSAAERGHLHKLDDSLAGFVRDELTSANCRMLDGPPKNLNPDQQTLFALGFYQQTAYLRVVGEQVSKKHRHRSDLGEWMRSKLEVKVANLMNKVRLSYVYECSAILPNAGERWPDFVIRGGGEPKNDTYVEVAGYPGEEYDRRHRLKIDAYREMKITEEGGEGGRLVVLDYRDKDYDDKSVLDALNFLLNSDTQTASEEN